MRNFLMNRVLKMLLCSCLLPVLVHADALPRIVNGDDAPPGEFPTFANLQATFEFGGNGDLNKFWPNCGGIIIAGQYLWTADHCLVAFGSDRYFWQEGGSSVGPLNFNFRLVVGLEKQRFALDPEEQLYYSTPEAYNQILPIIDLTADPFDRSDFFNQQDFTIINLSSIIADDQPLLINKAIYLGKKTDLKPTQDALVIGFGNAACVQGDCNIVPDAQTSYPNLRQVQVELQRDGCEAGETDLAPFVCVVAERVDLDNDDGYSNVSHGDSGGPVMVKNAFGDYVSYGSTFQGYVDDQGRVSNRQVEFSAIPDSRVNSIVGTIRSWHAPTLQSSLKPNQLYAFRLQNLTPDTLNIFDLGLLTVSDNVELIENSDCDRELAPFEICNFEYRLNSVEQDGKISFQYQERSLDVLLTSRIRPLQPDDDDNGGGGGGGSVSVWMILLMAMLTLFRRRQCA
ncbi:MAG: GlyGly-CTERM sorting domain-containing protein [Pseudomonadales bacterium]|nr:GlyGly-CTERM sorting domain-containing protein [Pseudomonadales bacterium]